MNYQSEKGRGKKRNMGEKSEGEYRENEILGNKLEGGEEKAWGGEGVRERRKRERRVAGEGG